MAPTIDVIRHAEATHNVTGDVYARDPVLTERGEAQAYRLARAYPHMARVRHVVCSPLRRAVRTALIAFEDRLLGGQRAVLLPELQETGVRPSDVGQPRAVLEATFRPHVDASALGDGRDGEGWCYKGPGSKYVPDVALVEARAREARLFLRGLARAAPDDARIVVVSHGGFLHFLTEDFAGLSERYFTAYGNTTMRSFQFADLHGTDTDATLVETEESCQGLGFPCWASVSEEEKARLKSYAVARIESQKQVFDRMTRCNRRPM
ncbi:phosphoglycerate mutase-like protein [Xylariaceae sp. FL1651]|nr:phosphoglycerate mutase-like protein [Xylariaceae sp. FL1651]